MSGSKEVAVKIETLSKTFKLPHEKTTSIKSAIISGWRKSRSYEVQKALNNISFDINKGEFFGIVGRNGSGKSTLLKLIAGIYTPTEGTIKVNGTLTPFIELGVGFNPELTGRENVFLNGALLGFNRKQMSAMYNDIVEFAELDRFMDQKLKNYSSGMQVRLAFSIAIRAESDILLIDEVLAVGDISFQEKCYQIFSDIKKTDRTVVFVSHDHASMLKFCDRIAIINDSALVRVGKPQETVMEYETIIANDDMRESKNKKTGNQQGTGDFKIMSVQVLDKEAKVTNTIRSGQKFSISAKYKVNNPKSSVVCGISINDSTGASILGPNTEEAKFKVQTGKAGETLTIRADFKDNKLVSGRYTVTVGLFNHANGLPYHFWPDAAAFKLIGEVSHGKIVSKPDWSVKASS